MKSRQQRLQDDPRQEPELRRLGDTTWLTEMWRYRELLAFFVWRDVKIKYKQSLLGIGWAILQPVFTVLVFTLFFGRLAGLPSEGAPYPVFYYSAVLPWTFFATALSSSGNSLVSNSNLITKVYFPRAVVPISAVVSGLVDFAFASTILFFLLWYYDLPFTRELIFWPLLMTPLVLLAVGVGMILSALNVRYRDVKYALPFMVQAWMFISPVIYPSTMIPERYRFLLFLNPMGGILDAFRASVLPNTTIDWSTFGISISITAGVLVCGILYFRHTEREFADII